MTLGFLLNVALTYNSLTETPTDCSIQNRRFKIEEGTDYHGSCTQEADKGAVGTYGGLRILKWYSKPAIGPFVPLQVLSAPCLFQPIFQVLFARLISSWEIDLMTFLCIDIERHSLENSLWPSASERWVIDSRQCMPPLHERNHSNLHPSGDAPKRHLAENHRFSKRYYESLRKAASSDSASFVDLMVTAVKKASPEDADLSTLAEWFIPHVRNVLGAPDDGTLFNDLTARVREKVTA